MEKLSLICVLLVTSIFSHDMTFYNQTPSCLVPEVDIMVHAAYQYVDVIASVAAAVEDMNDLYQGQFRLKSVSLTNKTKFFCEQLAGETIDVAALYYYRAQRCTGTTIFLSPCKISRFLRRVDDVS